MRCKEGYKLKNGKCVKKCKEGHKLKNGKCVKRGIIEDLNPTTKRFFGFTREQKQGIFLIALSILIWLLRPFQTCKWYQIGCHAGSTALTPIFIILAGIVLIVGILRLVNKK